MPYSKPDVPHLAVLAAGLSADDVAEWTRILPSVAPVNVTPSRLRDVLAAHDGTVIALVGAASADVARRMQAGQSLGRALDGWAATMRGLLEDRRSGRARVIALSIDSVRVMSADAQTGLAGRLGNDSLAFEGAPVPEADAMLRAIARLAIVADPMLCKLEDDIGAFTFGAADAEQATAITAAALASRSQMLTADDRQTPAPHEPLTTEVNLLRAALGIESEDRDRNRALARTNVDLSTANTLLDAELRALRTKLESLQNLGKLRETLLGTKVLQEMARRTAERRSQEREISAGTEREGELRTDLLEAHRLAEEAKAQLDAAHTRLAAQDAEIQDLKQRLAGAEGRVVAQDAELAAVYASRSWRVTGPLRATSSRIRKPEA